MFRRRAGPRAPRTAPPARARATRGGGGTHSTVRGCLHNRPLGRMWRGQRAPRPPPTAAAHRPDRASRCDTGAPLTANRISEIKPYMAEAESETYARARAPGPPRAGTTWPIWSMPFLRGHVWALYGSLRLFTTRASRPAPSRCIIGISGSSKLRRHQTSIAPGSCHQRAARLHSGSAIV